MNGMVKVARRDKHKKEVKKYKCTPMHLWILHHQTSNGHKGETILGNKQVKMEFLMAEMNLSYLRITEFGL